MYHLIRLGIPLELIAGARNLSGSTIFTAGVLAGCDNSG